MGVALPSPALAPEGLSMENMLCVPKGTSQAAVPAPVGVTQAHLAPWCRARAVHPRRGGSDVRLPCLRRNVKEKPVPCLHLVQPAVGAPLMPQRRAPDTSSPPNPPNSPSTSQSQPPGLGQEGWGAAGEGAQGHQGPAHVADSSLWASRLLHVVRLCGLIPAYEQRPHTAPLLSARTVGGCGEHL